MALAGLFAMTSLSAQHETRESLMYEVQNLREQIAIIIQNNNASLMEMDEELAANKSQLKKLESENAYLRQKVNLRGDSFSAMGEDPAIQQTRSKIARLERDNQFLREALALEREDARKDARNMVNRLNLLETQKHHILNQNDSLRRSILLLKDAESWKGKYQQAENRALKLEVENKSLWQQSKISTTTQRKELDKQEAYIAQLEQKLAAAEIRNEELESQMVANLAFVKKTVNEKEALIRRNTQHQRSMDSLSLANSKAVHDLRFEPFTERQHQQMDSLKYENNSLKRQLSVLNSAESIKQSRIQDLEDREADVREALLRMEIRDQLMRDRAKELDLRQQELELQEIKYQGLAEKEVRLKMIEQKLRAAVKEDGK